MHDAQRLVLAPQRGVEDAARGRRGGGEVLDVSSPSASATCMSRSAARSLPASASARPGEPARRRHHQRHAERAGMEAVGDGQAFAARLPFARRHRLVGDEQIVQPARAGQADFVGGVQHARRGAQQVARVVERERLQEGLRRQPAPAAEQMMQLGRRDAGGVGDGVDLGLRAPVAADMGDGAAHDVVIGRGGRQLRQVRMAAGKRQVGAVMVSCGHAHDRYLGRAAGANHPISCRSG